MHVTFVSLGSELIGVECLSASLKQAGHTTSAAHNPALFNDRFQLDIPLLARFFDQDDRIVEWILHLNPDLLAFSALTNTFSWCIEIARRVREVRRIPTIFGNMHASAVPEFVMGYDEVDYVCQGEGEAALVALAGALERGEDGVGIPNIWTKPGGVITPPETIDRFLADLDAQPFPDKDLYAAFRPPRYVYRIITARGCPYRCTFCFNNFFAELPSEGTSRDYIRRRSPQNVLDELVRGKQLYDMRAVEFVDDIFTMDKAWLAEFLPAFKEQIGLPWFCETHANFMDDDLAQLMKDTGCIAAQMGVQSLEDMEYKRTTLKRYENEASLVRAFASFRKARLRLEVDHIFGLPGETEAGRQRALEFYRTHAPSRVSCYWLTYFPGIEMTEQAHASGELDDEHMRRINSGNILWYYQVHSVTEAGRRDLDVNRGYMIAFDLMPYLPRLLRGVLRPSWLQRIPLLGSVSRFVPAVDMLIQWLRTGYYDGVMYLRLYWHHTLGAGRHLNKVKRSTSSRSA